MKIYTRRVLGLRPFAFLNENGLLIYKKKKMVGQIFNKFWDVLIYGQP